MKKTRTILSAFVLAVFTHSSTAYAFAGGQVNNWNFFEISASDSIGQAMYTSLWMAIIRIIFSPHILIVIIPALILLSFFLHRKYVVPAFGGLYIFLFLFMNLVGLFSIREFAVLYFMAIITILFCFMISTLFNRRRKEKHKFSSKDWYPLIVLLLITILLLLMPIKVNALI